MKNYPLRLAISYFVLASCWIFFSDHFVEILFPLSVVGFVQTVKGVGFITATAFGLYFMVKHYYRVIQRSEKEYRELFKDNPHPMWVFDPETLKFLAVNNAAISKYHYTEEEFRSKTISDIRPEEDIDSLYSFMKRLDKKLYQDAGIWRHKDKFGKVFYVRITSHSTTFGNIQARVVLAMDIDEQIQAQQKIHLSEMKLKSLINNTDDLIWMVDTGKKVITANDAFITRMKKRYDVDVNPEKKFDLHTIMHRGFMANWNNYIEEALQGGSLRIEESVNTATGIEYYDVVLNPIYSDDRQIMGAGCFARDITQRKQSENRIKQQVAQLSEVAWIQSHQVRKPLANLLGLMDLLQQQPVNESTQQELLGYMQTSCKELDAIVKKIITRASDSDNL